VAILEVNTVEVKILESNYFPELVNYGKMPDDCYNFNAIFEKGTVYGIIGECGAGGWGLSYNLAGYDSFIEGEIKINGELVGLQQLKQYGWYVGDFIRKSFFGRNQIILKQIKNGIKKSGQTISIEEIIELFELTPCRLKRKYQYLGWEKWNASIATGFAHGKKIFSFPWLNTSMINALVCICGIHRCIDVLKKNGAIVIIPTEKAEAVELLVDKIIHLENTRHLPSERVKKILTEWKNGK